MLFKKRVAAERAAIESMLTRWPWRKYPYKYGRWVYEEKILTPWLWPIALVLDTAPTKNHWSISMEAALVCDPDDGSPLGELEIPMGGWFRRTRDLAPYSGTLEFAGDPRVMGVLKANTGSGRLRLVHSDRLYFSDAVQAAHTFTPGDVEVRRTRMYHFTKNSVFVGDRPPEHRFSPWVADLLF